VTYLEIMGRKRKTKIQYSKAFEIWKKIYRVGVVKRKVLVCREWQANESGGHDSPWWAPPQRMNTINSKMSVSSVDTVGVNLRGIYYPFFVLQVVK